MLPTYIFFFLVASASVYLSYPFYHRSEIKNGNNRLNEANFDITLYQMISDVKISKCLYIFYNEHSKLFRTERINDECLIFVDPRGGSLTIEDTNENFAITAIQKIIIKLLKITNGSSVEKKFKVILEYFEEVTGIEVLPFNNIEENTRENVDKGKIIKSKNTTLNNEFLTELPLKRKRKDVKKLKRSTMVKSRSSISRGMFLGVRNHLEKDVKMTHPNYRIQREMKDFLSSPPPNMSVKVGKNIRLWIITLTGAKNTIYEGEKYRLRVKFPDEYPTVPPSMYFLQPTPRHEHVYTNGDICLSLLGKDWRPTMTAQSIAMSILSILSGAQRKCLPMDNARHAHNKPGERQDDWIYHDNNC